MTSKVLTNQIYLGDVTLFIKMSYPKHITLVLADINPACCLETDFAVVMQDTCKTPVQFCCSHRRIQL